MLEKWKKPEYEKEVKRTSAGNGQKEERKKERKKKGARGGGAVGCSHY